RELLARVRAVLRRSAPASETGHSIRRGDLTIDTERHEVTWQNTKIALTATEFRILEYLAARPERVMSRDEIIDGALGKETSIFDRTIDVHVTALRKKLGSGGKHIETVRGFGYKWTEAPGT